MKWEKENEKLESGKQKQISDILMPRLTDDIKEFA